MKYGLIGIKGGVYKKHYGLLYNDGSGNIKLNLMNKYCASNLRSRNNKFFDELLILINKYYDLEDLNKKNTTGLCPKNYNRIKRGSMKKEI